MRRFRYVADPVCLGAIGLYALNRWLLKPFWPAGFLHDQLNDLLLVPAALPLVLGLHRACGWRRHDGGPTISEIALHVAVWSLVCEWIGPGVFAHGTADFRDVLAYAAGAALAWLWWNRPALRPQAPDAVRA